LYKLFCSTFYTTTEKKEKQKAKNVKYVISKLMWWKIVKRVLLLH